MTFDTYEIDLNSEKPTPNQFEMNKLAGNQKSGKSIFDVKLNESGKPENDGLVELEVLKAKPSSKSNSPTKRKKKMRGKQWKKDVVMFLQTLIHIIKHFNTTINSKEFTTFLHKINPEIHLSLHLILNNKHYIKINTGNKIMVINFNNKTLKTISSINKTSEMTII